MAYATLGELEERWRKLTSSEAAVAETLLDDAAVYLNAELSRTRASADLEALRVVSCSMVRRALESISGSLNVSQYSQSAGGYSESFTYANPSADLYLTKGEKRLLGIGAQRMRFVGPWMPKEGEEKT